MKQIFLIIAIFAASVLSVQANDTDSITLQRLQQAHRLLTSGGQERAFQTFLEIANTGNAKAMNAVGILLQRGWGVEKDEEASVEWFRQSSALGYDPANVNLSHIYAKGLGVEQSFEKAALYAEKLLPVNPQWANFRLGYFHYKGLGVEQNYERAVEFFRIAANEGSANAYYFLGLAYRNGFGVSRNAGEAQFFLRRAAQMGHHFSKEELSRETAETEVPALRLAANTMPNINQVRTFRQINRQRLTSCISGEYEGNLITYDFSGQQIVRNVSLRLTISTPDVQGRVTGEWIEADSIRANFEAFVTDSTLRFENTTYARTDFYNQRQAVVWNFTDAVLEKTETRNGTLLAGNIRMFSPRTRQPERPMYISLRRTRGSSENAEFSRNSENRHAAHFMPGSNDLRISFTSDTPQPTAIRLYTILGQLVYSENLGYLPAARHDYVVNLPVPAGQYILLLQQGTESRATKIIKQ